MRLLLTNTGKRYNREWIFRHVDYTFDPGGRYAITGPNGSGKSTLLQVISGAITHSEGSIQYEINGAIVKPNEEYKQVSIAAPYLELIEEMTANEFLQFHTKFKPLTTPLSKILQIIGLEKAADKQIRYYSSGMKQRLKLAQAFFTDASVLLLDEPTTNLDKEGIALYHQLIANYTANKLIIVSSNDTQEYDFCEQVIKINDYKS
ncbi:ABC transporter ATP-binding protein [Ferruginibacter lapsinanis]|uniref:ABC transporter ATP-binding protein n=1 Tax=Ferruginibacter lapsinanis TaxID=563172 RepID=UPI001E44E333|nr:ABC transporter ATP-binding protein [Ferruginibacter lapsinanis]UEG51106.1 ABC transporter ATP-binding protein [Ferruginibacter lapsinanis]